MHTLKMVGYWPVTALSETSRYPDPTALVCPRWREQDRAKIAAYLRAGVIHNQWRGHSYCRFKCGVPHAEMGSRCLTDGDWVWPEGLAHYIEQHQVRLPDEFAATMEQNGWTIPEDAEKWASRHADDSFWVAWANTRPSC